MSCRRRVELNVRRILLLKSRRRDGVAAGPRQRAPRDSADRRLEGTDDDTTSDAHNRTDAAARPPVQRRQHARTAPPVVGVPSAANGGAPAVDGGNVTATAVVVGATLFRCRSPARGPVLPPLQVHGPSRVNLRRRTIGAAAATTTIII